MSQSAALNLDESRGVADPSRAAWTALIQVLVLTGLWIALHLLFVLRAIILFGLVAWREPGLFPGEVQPAGSPVG